jgi:Predicted hydrolases or acyltransferases (alpha/beta hydrolase superfamily)
MTRSLLLIMLLLLGQANAEEVKLAFSGITLNANLERTERWPAGPTLLITHGTLSHNRSEIITTLQELFLENGVSSLAINLSLGIDDRHGPYDCPVPHTHRHEDALDEIGAWLDWLEEQDVKQVVLLGHSRGGNQTAWFAAERNPPTVSRVILVAPQTWSPEYAARTYQERYGKPLAPVLARARALVEAGKGATLLKPVDFVYCKETAATADAFVSYYAPDPRKDTPHLLPRLNRPVLVFAATEDQVVKGLPDKLAPLAGKAGFELTVIEGADHFFRDLYAEELVERAIEFIGE